MRPLFLFAAFLAACATPAAAPLPDASPVIAAERAFAADASVNAWVPAFRKFLAPDAIMLRPDPTSAADLMAQADDDGDKTLVWWPSFAGMARSGEMGLTTGPVQSGGNAEVRSHYFTVWKKQPDGAWKWIYDGGVGARDPSPLARDAVVPTLATAQGGAASPQAAIAEVQAVERAHATPAAIWPLLADTAHVNRGGAAPALNKSDAKALFDLPTPDIAYTPYSAQSSAGGDMVFSLASARWTQDGVARRGYAVRIWQWTPEGWRLAYDQLNPAPAGR